MISRRAGASAHVGRVAELWEQVRPSYPRQLVEEVLDYAALEPADRVLDVGAGTGNATRQFAARGHPIVALEPSAEMAAVARSTTGGLPSVTVVQAEFERWAAPPAPFKLLISAQAWHWIDPETRCAKARAVLKPGGAIAVFGSHVDWESEALGPALDPVYRETAPDFAPTGPMHPEARRGDVVWDWCRT